MREDEDGLLCDFAEFYHIFDIFAFSPVYISTLAVGLPDSSRIKRRLSNTAVPISELLQASAVDLLGLLLYTLQVMAGAKPRKPKSISSSLLGTGKEKAEAFMTYEDFEEEKRRIINSRKEVEDGN